MDVKTAIIAIAVGAVGFVNIVLSTLGMSPLPIDESMVTATVTFVFIIVGFIGGLYKNWNVTDAAKAGQELTDAIKDEEITLSEAASIMAKAKHAKDRDAIATKD